MRVHHLLLVGLLTASSSWAATANLLQVSNPNSGVFIFNVNGQPKHLFCDQFTPNATSSPYVANIATLADLTGSTLAVQGDPQALFKYQRVAILVLLALADPSISVSAVSASRRIVDGVGPLTPAAQALYDFALAANAAAYDLTGFRIYTNVLTQELTGYDTGLLQICKIAGNGVAVGSSFTFNIAGVPLNVQAGAAPGGTCSTPRLVPVGNKVITETLPVGIVQSSFTSSPNNALVSNNLMTGVAAVTITENAQTTVTVVDSAFVAPETTGAIQICKVAGAGITVGTNFTFNVTGAVGNVNPITVAAGAAPGGNCSTAIPVTAGAVAVTETVPAGTTLTAVNSVPAAALTSMTLATGVANFTVAAGTQVTATFINAGPSIPNTGFLQICKVAGNGIALGTNFTFNVAGTPVTVAAGSAPGGTCSNAIVVPAGSNAITETLPASTSLSGVSTVPNNLLVSSNLAAGTATVTVNQGGQTIVTFINTLNLPVIELPIFPQDLPYQIKYVSNLNLGDSFINITNTGARGAGIPSGSNSSTTGAICVNVYAFSPDEQMVSCCSCPVTPNGLVSLSVRTDIISNTLTPAVPTALVIKLLATVPAPGAMGCAGAAFSATPANLAPGLAAWGTTLHVSQGATQTTETPFLPATLSLGGNSPGDIGELTRLTQLCTFINAIGSGFGICRSCHLGGLGAGRL